MTLTVVIPSKITSNLIPCLDAIRRHEPNARVIIIDDGLELSGIGHDPLTTYEKGVKPFIFARAVNQGIRAAGDSDIVACNDDALLESPGGFSLLQRAAEEHPEFGIVGAVTNLTGQPAQQRQSPICPECYGEKLDYRHGDEVNWTCRSCGHAWLGPILQGLRQVEHIAFVCVLLPRRTIESVGLMDERYCIDWGCCDADYCEAVARAGLKIAVHDGTYVDHGSLRSTRRGDPTTHGDFRQNYRLLVEKWGGHLVTQPILRHLLEEIQ